MVHGLSTGACGSSHQTHPTLQCRWAHGWDLLIIRVCVQSPVLYPCFLASMKHNQEKCLSCRGNVGLVGLIDWVEGWKMMESPPAKAINIEVKTSSRDTLVKILEGNGHVPGCVVVAADSVLEHSKNPGPREKLRTYNVVARVGTDS
jgi:hypothetical protein